jgi:cyclic pyranopterin phosphate synthase
LIFKTYLSVARGEKAMLHDALGRSIRYLRVSVTDRCNFRCQYCMPAEGVKWVPHDDILCYEEMLQVVRACVNLGVDKVRITGGEPLLRKGILSFIRQIADTPGIREVGLTTNGTLLEENAFLLKEAGVSRVNVSLDTMKRDRFQELTGQDALDKVLAGIQKAEEVGFPIKINMVVMKDFNSDEIVDFVALAQVKAYQIRFIEYMPFLPGKNYLMTAEEMKENLAKAGYKRLISEVSRNSHVKKYHLPQSKGSIGFITPVSQHFCDTCDRIRLTADGYLKLCLFSNEDYLLRNDLRAGITDKELQERLQALVLYKPRGHQLDQEGICKQAMSRIGG